MVLPWSANKNESHSSERDFPGCARISDVQTASRHTTARYIEVKVLGKEIITG